MRYEQPIPFYMAYPFLLPLDQEQAQEKDLQVMKSFYSRRAARIQEKADRECDRMEYDGSMMIGVQMILADGKASHLLPLLRNPDSSSQRFHIQFLLHRICCPFFL